MSARYPLATSAAVSTSGTGQYRVDIPLPCTRAAIMTYADRAGTVQAYLKDSEGTYRAHGTAQAVAVDTMHVMLVDYPVDAVQVDYVEGGAGAAVVSMHVVVG
jgi:hypothetical protein